MEKTGKGRQIWYPHFLAQNDANGLGLGLGLRPSETHWDMEIQAAKSN